GYWLRRVWDYEAGGWLDERHLWLSVVIGYPLGPVVLDVSGGRTVTVSDDDVKQARSEQQWREWWAEQGPPFELSSALEELPPDFAGGWDYLRPVVGRAGVYVVYTKDRDDEPVALYAVSDDPAPRILRLT